MHCTLAHGRNECAARIEEAIGFLGPIAGVVDTNARTPPNVSRSGTLSEIKWGVAKVDAVHRTVDAVGLAELPRAVRHDTPIFWVSSARAHWRLAHDGFDCAKQYGAGVTLFGGDKVQMEMQSVDQKHISMSRWTKHAFIASRAPSAKSMASRIANARIGFRFDDATDQELTV